MMRTVHRLKKVFFLAIAKFKRRELAIAVIWIMSASFIQINITYMRSNDGQVSSFFLFIAEEGFKGLPKNCTFRKPNRKSSSYFLREHEKFKFLTKSTVIAFFSFFKESEVIIEH